MAGGGSSRGSGGKKKARIEIIPLIDVIFFLLATFVLFTLSLNKPVGLPVTLPDAETGIPRDPNGIPTVTVQQDGTPAWDQEPVTLQELINRLQEFHNTHPEQDAHIIINGDTNAPWSQVVYVFDQAHRAGIPKVFIETHAKNG
ncbi:MAG TPA: biopolymer transporter ExbD [Opitutaceae bacterium]|jgi:biopolymer transport protein ExbD